MPVNLTYRRLVGYNIPISIWVAMQKPQDTPLWHSYMSFPDSVNESI